MKALSAIILTVSFLGASFATAAPGCCCGLLTPPCDFPKGSTPCAESHHHDGSREAGTAEEAECSCPTFFCGPPRAVDSAAISAIRTPMTDLTAAESANSDVPDFIGALPHLHERAAQTTIHRDIFLHICSLRR